jgi:acetylornithine deacetylase/succinyl-diaminopimelate desuccinylase-like protein
LTATGVDQGVLERIDADELADLAVELGNVYSPTGHDEPAAAWVYDWLGDHGFAPQKLGITDERYNVLGRLKGSGGGGTSLIFNSHLDNLVSTEDHWTYVDPSRDVLTKAWRDGDKVWGLPVVNCKGPMACWMIACKALKEAGADLRGDVLLTHVCGEIELEAVDEFQGIHNHSHDLGARYLVARGAVADYALVAEATDFEAGLVEAGKAWFKVTVKAGPTTYTPFYPRGIPKAQSPNAIVQMSRFVDRFEDWAESYTERYTVETEWGTIAPKAVVGAIRGGSPPKLWRAPEICSAYVDVRMNLDTSPLTIKEELEAVAAELGIEVDVQQFAHRRGAAAVGVEPLYDALERAHEQVLGRPLEKDANPPTISMWRDTTPFNEAGIPSLTYGPGANAATGKGYFTTDEMVAAAQVYARVALDLCNRDRRTR